MDGLTSIEKRAPATIARYEEVKDRLPLKVRLQAFEQMTVAQEALERGSRRRLVKGMTADIDTAIEALDKVDALLDKATSC